MRQRESKVFAKILNRLREGKYTKDDRYFDTKRKINKRK
jgi:hypothetical protein